MRVAVIAGDGVGPEVIGVAAPLMVQAAHEAGVSVHLTKLPWGSSRYRTHGRAFPEGAAQELEDFDAVLFGALGDPELPEHEIVGSLIELRKQLDLAANLRPVELWPGIPTPFHEGFRASFVVVRENTEGEYSGLGGRTRAPGGGDMAVAIAVHSQATIERLARFAFTLAERRNEKLTLITKSNAIFHAFSLWEEVVREVASEFVTVEYEECLVDAAAARIVQRPHTFDVLLCSNLFGDVLSEIGSTLQGGLGMSPSANVPIVGERPGLFEPIHGSAPDLAGRGIANPTGAILASALLLDHVGVPEAADRLRRATRAALASPGWRTPDLGGDATTEQVGRAIAALLEDARVDGEVPERCEPVSP